MKISNRAIREFEFYLNSPLSMIGQSIGSEPVFDPHGFSALECWWAKDTHGKTLPCREPELLAKAMQSKASVNLQVKLWAEDLADGMLLTRSELLEYVKDWPEWVFRAVVEQASKRAMKTIGFVPGFIAKKSEV